MTPEQQKMVEENHSLIYSFLQKKQLSLEYYGDAAIGLCMAAIKFDPNYGTKFSTYAFRSMETHCIRAKKNEQKHMGQISLDASIKDDSEFSLLDTLIDEKIDLESSAFTNWFLGSLSLFDLNIVLLKLQGLSLREIGNRLGCSGQNIDNHLKAMRGTITKMKSKRDKPIDDLDEKELIINEIKALL